EDPGYERIVDIMYLACNRLEFTKASFEAMRDNTDWFYVRSLWVYDDGSTDGTREYLEEAIQTIPADRRFVKSDFGGPIGPMQHFVTHATSPYLAKIDNDTMLPAEWLETALAVMGKNPDLHLLGIEPFGVERGKDLAHDDYGVVDSSHGHIGGIGLFRASAFIDSQPEPEPGKYFGFWHWQSANPHIKRGFINPGIPVFLLDRMPMEPWRGLSDEYIRKGWQRPWTKYTEQQSELWEWHFQPA
ncbi:MAG TPA: glycosyltransferase family A protein, partial [Armatimonadota bacterium]|nr:glycosyltransferase family A protein [Armatimonadota bacterium]